MVGITYGVVECMKRVYLYTVVDALMLGRGKEARIIALLLM